LATQDERLAAIAAAAATVLRRTPYHAVRAGDVAAAVRLPGERGRSAVWLYNEVHNRRVLVALAAAYAWRDFPGRTDRPYPQTIQSVTAARSAAAAALAVVVAFHRAEQPLMTQVGYGIGDISTAEKRQLAAGHDVTPPRWPVSEWGQVAAAAWRGRCDVFTDFLGPVLRDCAQSVTYLAEADAAENASRLSDIAFRTCLADRDGPVDLVARGLAALWFERDLTRLAGTLPRDLESSETALAAGRGERQLGRGPGTARGGHAAQAVRQGGAPYRLALAGPGSRRRSGLRSQGARPAAAQRRREPPRAGRVPLRRPDGRYGRVAALPPGSRTGPRP
jgi:hypothetical protein